MERKKQVKSSGQCIFQNSKLESRNSEFKEKWYYEEGKRSLSTKVYFDTSSNYGTMKQRYINVDPTS